MKQYDMKITMIKAVNKWVYSQEYSVRMLTATES